MFTPTVSIYKTINTGTSVHAKQAKDLLGIVHLAAFYGEFTCIAVSDKHYLRSLKKIMLSILKHNYSLTNHIYFNKDLVFEIHGVKWLFIS